MDFPVFSVMDKVEEYKEKSKLLPGLYFVETDNYFPMRGNRWYLYTMVQYCLDEKIIDQSNIKYQIISSLSLKSDYFNPFINNVLEKLSDEPKLSKLSINGMIGSFKPKAVENWSSMGIDQNVNNVFITF